MSVQEYFEKFTLLARYAPNDTDSEDKKKERFLNGLHGELQYILVVMPFQDLESLAGAAIMMENKRQSVIEDRKRKMQLQQGSRSAPRAHSAPPARPPPPRAPTYEPRPSYAPRPSYPSAPRPSGGTYAGGPNKSYQPVPRPSGGCFSCGKPGHYSRDCTAKAPAAPRPNATKMTHDASKKKPVAKGHMHLMSAEEAKEATDLVIGTFPVNSIPATVLFDSGASHSFVTKQFDRKSHLELYLAMGWAGTGLGRA